MRLESERKLRALPSDFLAVAWVQRAQVEAVIDAVLVTAHGPYEAAISHARRVGEWCARIAGQINAGPNPEIARRVGVLADVSPATLLRIPELCHLADHVADFQRASICNAQGTAHILTMIVSVATEFDERMRHEKRSASTILRAMLREARAERCEVVGALHKALHARFASAAIIHA